MSEGVILLMTCLIKYVFQAKQKIKSKRFQHDYRHKYIKNLNKTCYHQNVNVNSIVENVTLFKIWITISDKYWYEYKKLRKHCLCEKGYFGILYY